MEEVRKRKAQEELEHYRQKVRAKQQNETRSLEDFRFAAVCEMPLNIVPLCVCVCV